MFASDFVRSRSKGSKRWRRNQRLKCGCGGYWFPHRRAGGACEHSKTRSIHLAIRGGNPQEIFEARLDHAERYPVMADPAVIPF